MVFCGVFRPCVVIGWGVRCLVSVNIAAMARKTKASGEAKLEAELVFGVEVVEVVEDLLVLELVVEALVVDDPS